MDARRKSQDASSRPPPRPRRPSNSLPSVPLLHTLDPAFAQALGPASDQVRSTSALSPPPAHFSTTSAYRPATTNFPTSTDPQATLRAVTPDLTEEGAHNGIDTNNRQSSVPGPAATGSSRVAAAGVVVGGGGSSGSSGSGGSGGGLGSRSSPNSPSRSIPIVPGSNMSNASTPGSSRRQGVVFNDAFPNSLDSASSSPPRRSPVRPRGHTMDGPYRQPSITPPIEPPRHRVGSVSSTGSMSSMPPHEEILRGPPVPRHSPMIESPGYTSMYHTRPTDLHIQTGGAVKDKKGPTRAKLMKRTSRPTSPMLSPPPSADSLVLPVPTDDANKVLWLMKNLCGRMRGEVSYQVESNGPWYTGLCYIEDERGSLMFDSSDNSIFHTAIIPDLRGCRVLPVERPDMDRPCLELVNPQNGAEVLLWPSKADEADLWLAALLSWQQLRPSALRTGSNSQTTTPTSQSRPELIRRGSSTASTAPNVIKVSLVSLWDRGVAHSPRAIVKRASTRDLRSAQTGWRKVSCILYDNGELKLITEHDGAIQCVIPLSQLSRCAIQQLDKSVLDEEFCIAIVPSYASTATQLSLFRPIFISLEGRVLFEVWFVLMRAFTVPEIYALDDSEEDSIVEVTDFEAEPTSEMFRVEKTINLRIIEAKLGGPTSPVNSSARDRHGKHEQDAFVGNYFVEVHLDGDLRARTITKMATRTPFWRDDCEFTDLSANLPALQVVLKRYEGNMDSLAFPLHISSRLPRGVNLTEIKCGSVDIPLHNLDRGRDYEEWRQIHDDRQQLIGTLLCKVRHEELIVFMARDYKAISEMLHRFSLGLTAQISEALPGHLRRLAEFFLNIFQVTNKSSEWLMALVEDEIDGIGQQAQMKKMRFSRRLKSSEALDVANANEREALRDMGKTLAGEANLLFRGNSLLTQALEFYMRRLGSDYVEEILGDKIYEINEINPNCEVDPGKLQQGEDINQHWDQLIHFTNEIWECIAQSASRFPPELRHILKYIRAVAEDRYGDFLRTVAFTSVSGFLFLRFICPAVLNPKLFGLLRDYPRPRAQRTLTLIAKALQALANLSSIGKKEVWMEPMNRRFLSARRQGLKDFIDEVCSIPAQSASIILPAPYSTPVTILGRLSPLAREGFPSLPFLVDHARNFASLVKLWIDHNKGHTGDGRYDGELLAFHRECTALQERADMCMNRIDAVRSMDHENLSLPTDSDLGLADALEQVNLNDFSNNNNVNAISRGSSITPWPDASFTAEKPPGSSRGSSFDEERGYNSRPYRASERRAHSRHHRPPPWSVDSYSTSAGSSHQQHQQHRHHDQGPPNVMKSLRTSKNAKKFISGILRKIDRDKFSGSGSGSLDVAPSSSNQSYLGASSSQSQHFLSSSGSRVVSDIGGAGGYDDTNNGGGGGSKLGSATTSTGTMRRDKEKGKSLGLGGLVDGWNESSRH